MVTDMMGTHSYMFNTTNKLFEKAEVRRALSLALDRNAIAQIVTFAKPATGYVPFKVFDTASGTSFREVGGNILSSITTLISDQGINIDHMFNKSKGKYAYTVLDLDDAPSAELIADIKALDSVYGVRVINP